MNTLAERTKQRRNEMKISQASLAKQVGCKQQTIGQIENGKITETGYILKLANALGVSANWLTGLSEDQNTTQQQPIHADIRPPANHEMPRDLPVLGTAAGSVSGALQIDHDPVDFVRRPPALAKSPQAYALYVRGDSNAPVYHDGDLIFVHPGRPARIGDWVVIQIRNHDADHPQSWVKRLSKQDDKYVVAEGLNPPQIHTFKREHVIAVHRVLTMNDLFGV
ncbi:MAG: helix-turn-helix transcriptional regulator [Alphaproteobacteria bacterium]|nr:helix-turn-helix transcriptional regulator [Alphaproteobacteria bacterium]